ncbi:potassium-transporting ATPase subunit F [Aneurinibacillus thermoaerophilus]|uniref:Potassium-transporting ATPase subunit F n=1 Tax=Aneurinibacillus thermoaerophilus TaxID=143495 RepID=A0ABX8YH50_ANETH|nr:potassium-transporting ATPase subunit F [Aneurinibacillus thermoaerophilus]
MVALSMIAFLAIVYLIFVLMRPEKF